MCLVGARTFLPGLNLASAHTDRANMAASVKMCVSFVEPGRGAALFRSDSAKFRRRQARSRSSGLPRVGEDRSKQIWQLLTLELWYRNAQSRGVAA